MIKSSGSLLVFLGRSLGTRLPGCNFGVKSQIEMKIWCVQVMHVLKVVLSEGLKSFNQTSRREL